MRHRTRFWKSTKLGAHAIRTPPSFFFVTSCKLPFSFRATSISSIQMSASRPFQFWNIWESKSCFRTDQTCCGQPMANSGYMEQAQPLAKKFIEVFDGYDYIVAPSGSCVSMVRNHYEHLCSHNDHRATTVRKRTMELSEFLINVLKVDQLPGKFPHQVGLHQSCHGLRELRLGPSPEVMTPRVNLVKSLLEQFNGIRFSELARKDECCGFGGTFAVAEEAVSCMMGDDRVNDHVSSGTEVLTAADMSCLMHLEGIIRRRKIPIRVMHFAEIMAEALSV